MGNLSFWFVHFSFFWARVVNGQSTSSIKLTRNREADAAPALRLLQSVPDDPALRPRSSFHSYRSLNCWSLCLSWLPLLAYLSERWSLPYRRSLSLDERSLSLALPLKKALSCRINIHVSMQHSFTCQKLVTKEGKQTNWYIEINWNSFLP